MTDPLRCTLANHYRTSNHPTKTHGTRAAHGAVVLRTASIPVPPDGDVKFGMSFVLLVLTPLTIFATDIPLPLLVTVLPKLPIERDRETK